MTTKPERGEEIRYFNRYTGKLEVEEVYGEAFLKWIYRSYLGGISLELLVKRAIFSKWYGWRMRSSGSRKKIRPFINRYGLDADEFVLAPEEFESFNAFFRRELKPAARPVCREDGAVVFPADGRHWLLNPVDRIHSFFVKGERFSLEELVGDPIWRDRYEGGAMLISRLCPLDYHWFHFPVRGTAGQWRELKGPLYSVNPIALKDHIGYLCKNRRWLSEIETQELGGVLMVEVGATCVGSVSMKYEGGSKVECGAPKGYFEFGGSTVITLFEKGKITWDIDLREWSEKGVEVYGKMGDRMGKQSGVE